jgi:hypothetical protein
VDDERLSIAIRKFLREVGVTSQREIERVVRDATIAGPNLRLRMALSSEDLPEWHHVVETTIELH